MSDDQGRLSKTETSSLDATAFGYVAWGARRNPDESPASYASFDVPVGGREFTGQEQIPEVGLVNMNGRLYDPSLGRFLSPDPNTCRVHRKFTRRRDTPVRAGRPWPSFGVSKGPEVKTPDSPLPGSVKPLGNAAVTASRA